MIHEASIRYWPMMSSLIVGTSIVENLYRKSCVTRPKSESKCFRYITTTERRKFSVFVSMRVRVCAVRRWETRGRLIAAVAQCIKSRLVGETLDMAQHRELQYTKEERWDLDMSPVSCALRVVGVTYCTPKMVQSLEVDCFLKVHFYTKFNVKRLFQTNSAYKRPPLIPQLYTKVLEWEESV